MQNFQMSFLLIEPRFVYAKIGLGDVYEIIAKNQIGHLQEPTLFSAVVGSNTDMSPSDNDWLESVRRHREHVNSTSSHGRSR